MSTRTHHALFVILALAGNALAQEDQLVFSAIPTRLGSISATGPGPAVVVTWGAPDAIAGLTEFRLYRDGALLATIPYAVRPGVEIEALYAAPENERRARELETNLEAAGVLTTPFGEAVAAQLTDDSFFAHFSSRLDPTLAVARGLGWVDRTASGTVKYRLDGVIDPGGTSEEIVVLGTATVDASTPWKAPAATAFRVLPAGALARCDAPEAMRAHGVLAFDWETPGTGGPERFALSEAIAGWDLYRSDAPALSDPARDLAAEAELLAHDDAGLVAFSGLVKVNDVPILAASDLPVEETTYEGWSPAAPQVTLGRLETAEAGMRPGETYAFYLVPRDRTGNYGETTSVLGKVPDTLPPPAPWNIRAVRRPTLNGGATPDTQFIRWPQVNVLNFVEEHPHRTYCNLEDAKFTRELAYVGTAETCPTVGEGARVSLRVAKYDIYRFESPADAQGFRDSDGDGVSDLLERAPLGDPAASPPLSEPGTACDPIKRPFGAPNFKVGSIAAKDAVPDTRQREVLEWADTVEEADLGKVFWYRVVAVGETGARGPMSAPVRAMFPAYRRTARRWVDPPMSCHEYITYHQCNSDDRPITDLTGTAAQATIQCGDKTWTFELTEPPPGAGLPSDAVVSEKWGQGMCGGQNEQAMPNECAGKDVVITYYDDAGNVIAQVTVGKYNGDICLCAQLNQNCFDPPPSVVDRGYEPVPYDPATECVSVYRRIGEELQRVETICDELVEDYESFYPDDLLGGPACLFQAVTSATGAISARFPLGCEEDSQAAAEVPTLAGLVFPAGATTAEVRIIPPEQPVLGFIAELRRADGTDRVTSFVRLGTLGTLGEVLDTIEVGPEPATGTTEEWCLRARTVVSNAAATTITDTLSDWTPDLCVLRMGPDAVEPEYIPWPEIPTPREAEALVALYLDGDGFPVVHLGGPKLTCVNESLFPKCVGTEPDSPKVDAIDRCLWPLVPLERQECAITCDTITESLEGQVGFVAYRQGRASSLSAAADYAQVSPLINYVHCTQITPDVKPPEGQVVAPPDPIDTHADPYVGLADFSGVFDGEAGPPWSGVELFFVDRAPHIAGWEYRYQFVYFDAAGEITETRTSNWVSAD